MSTWTKCFIDAFSGSIAELPKGKRTILNALRALDNDPRVSCFDRGSQWIESLLQEIKTKGLIEEKPNISYPWCEFLITDKGREMLENSIVR